MYWILYCLGRRPILKTKCSRQNQTLCLLVFLISSWKAFAHYVITHELNDRGEVCPPSIWTFNAVGHTKFNVVYHENSILKSMPTNVKTRTTM